MNDFEADAERLPFLAILASIEICQERLDGMPECWVFRYCCEDVRDAIQFNDAELEDMKSRLLSLAARLRSAEMLSCSHSPSRTHPLSQAVAELQPREFIDLKFRVRYRLELFQYAKRRHIDESDTVQDLIDCCTSPPPKAEIIDHDDIEMLVDLLHPRQETGTAQVTLRGQSAASRRSAFKASSPCESLPFRL